MRLSVMAMVAAALQTAGAPGAAVLAPTFGNTLVSTYPDGRTARLWIAADGTYTGQGRRGDRTAGHWSVSRGRLCMRQSRPIPIPFSWCTPLPDTVDVAGGWKAKAPTGEPIVVRLQAGGAPGAAAAR